MLPEAEVNTGRNYPRPACNLTAAPATWDEGDWNGDGVFDQLDLVRALQAGEPMALP